MDPPVIKDFSPAAEVASPDEVKTMWVSFSQRMETLSVERAFSLQADGHLIEGVFSWSQGNRLLSFTPLAPLFGPGSFTWEISRSAEDLYGNSLDNDFRHIFHTREERESPRVLWTWPDMENSAGPGDPIRIGFSRLMERASTAAAFSLSPPVKGFFSWEEDDRVFVFHPQEDYRPGETYQGRVGASACDRWGNTLMDEFNFIFTASGEGWKLESVETYPQGEILPAVPPGDFLIPHPEIEKDQIFLLRFSGPVPLEDRRYLANLLPTVPFNLSWTESGTRVSLEFTQTLVWGEIYELKIQDQFRRFRVNGQLSRPPSIRTVFFSSDPEVPPEEGQGLGFAHNLFLPPSAEVVFAIRISHGQGTEIPLASFLSAFSLSTGIGVQYCEPYGVELSSPEPGISLFRVFCRTGPSGRPGILRLQISKELRDLRDNRLQEDFVLMVNIL